MSRGRKIYLHYNEDGEPDAVADTMQELADQIGVGLSAVSKSLKNGSDLYGAVDDDEDVEAYIAKHADWVKVVRCKDCVFSAVDEFYTYWCQNKNARQGKAVPARWFCAEGRFTAEDD